MSPDEHAERLVRRVTWLERYRRAVATVAAIVIAPLLVLWISEWLPSSWRGALMMAPAIVLGAILWYVFEVLLGLAMSIWETDHAQLTRPASLPSAKLVRRK